MQEEQERRRRLVNNIVAFTAGTPLAATEYEQALLAQYVQGALSIEEVIELVELQQPAS